MSTSGNPFAAAGFDRWWSAYLLEFGADTVARTPIPRGSTGDEITKCIATSRERLQAVGIPEGVYRAIRR